MMDHLQFGADSTTKDPAYLPIKKPGPMSELLAMDNAIEDAAVSRPHALMHASIVTCLYFNFIYFTLS